MARRDAGETPERPLVDSGYLDRLEASLGPRGLGELLADGMIELADRIAALDALAREGDRAGVATLAHDIVAVAGHMGLGALSVAAAELSRTLREDAGRDHPRRGPRHLSALVTPVVALGTPSLEALKARGTGSSAAG